MIIIKTVFCQIAFNQNDEYAIFCEDSTFPNGEECEALVIQTRSKRYTLTGIDSGVLEGCEVVSKIFGYIKENINNDIIYIDLDELCGAENAMETITAFVSISSS